MEPKTVDIILLPFYAIVIGVGIFGNSLFIAVVRKRRPMQTVINFLLTNVAVSDIVSLAFLVPGLILRFFKHPSGNLGNFLCKFVTMHRVAGISLLVSGLTLTIISLERHNALLRPLDSRLKLNRRRTKTTICFTWGLSVAIVSPLFINEKYGEEHKTCFLDWNNTAARFAYWVCLATIVGISLVILSFCYFRILKAIYSGKIMQPNQSNVSEQDTQDKQKIIKLLLTMTGSFLVCFLPFVVVSTMSDISPHSALYRVPYFLVYTSCCVNPVVYIFQSENYRACLKDLWNRRPARVT
ncbi:galanin receptor type 1-like [Oculina patagonica]